MSASPIVDVPAVSAHHPPPASLHNPDDLLAPVDLCSEPSSTTLERARSDAELSVSTTSSNNSSTDSDLALVPSSRPDPPSRTAPTPTPPQPRGRSPRRLSSLLSRFSSAAVDASPSRSFRDLSRRESTVHRVRSSNRAPAAAAVLEAPPRRLRDEPRNRDPRSVAVPPYILHPTPPSQNHDSSTTSTSTLTLSRQSSITLTETVEDRRRELARSPSQASIAPHPEPARSTGDKQRKMHQTSSRLLRMTDDERPFTRVSLFQFGPRDTP
jgi:hypothetical protein